MISVPEVAPFAARAASPDFLDVDIASRADIVVHEVTIALVAPPGTTPSFSADEARRSLEIVDQFYDRETGGAVRFHLENLYDWQSIDEPIDCTNTGGLHDWIIRKTGWQPGPARHLVAMVPPGPPCPNWANGEQPGDPDDGGRTFQGGPDEILLAHELGHNLSLSHAVSLQCDTSWDYQPGANCVREEYGNKTDVMGDSWMFTPLSSATLARLGILSATRQPSCGAPRTTVLDSLGAGPGAQRALTWTDPADSAVRYWLHYNDKNDETSDGGRYWSPFMTPRTVSGVQVIRSVGGGAGELLQRPGDASDANEFISAGESVALNSGVTVRVDAIDETTRNATVTVDVPCEQFVGDITGAADLTASYTSPWSDLRSVADHDVNTAWSSWPRVGAQWIELRWPKNVSLDRAAVRFASDNSDTAGRGLIPARSWRVEFLDAASQTWRPVSNPSPAGRARDATNVMTFTRTETAALRVTFDAWGSQEYGGSTGVSELTVNGVAPDVQATTPVIDGTARVGTVLSASVAPWGPGSVALSYQWSAGGTDIPGATGTTYRPVAADLGKTIIVKVTGTKAGYTTVARSSSPTAAVAPGTLTSVVPTISGTPRVGATLTAKAGTWGPGTVALTYQWYAGGVALTDARSSTLVVPASARGKTIIVRVTGRQPGYTTATRTSAATATVNSGSLTTTTPMVSGTPRVGATLTAQPGVWGPGAVTLSYLWRADGSAITGATASSYTLTSASVGKKITVTVTGAKTGFDSASRTSAGVGPIAR